MPAGEEIDNTVLLRGSVRGLAKTSIFAIHADCEKEGMERITNKDDCKAAASEIPGSTYLNTAEHNYDEKLHPIVCYQSPITAYGIKLIFHERAEGEDLERPYVCKQPCLYEEWNWSLNNTCGKCGKSGMGDACKVTCGRESLGKRATSCDACQNQTTKMRGLNSRNIDLWKQARCNGGTSDCMWEEAKNGMPGKCVPKKQ